MVRKSSPKVIAERLEQHYSGTFARFGATSLGVDWGTDEEKNRRRTDQMLRVFALSQSAPPSPWSVLDVGCGFGSLWHQIRAYGLDVEYVGIDLSSQMIDMARRSNPEVEWKEGDFMEVSFPNEFDFVVCSGVLTQKLDTDEGDWADYREALVRRMFATCRVGIAFNLMTTYVNFRSPNLAYVNPSETLTWCIEELSRAVVIDHDSVPFEYTTYVLKRPDDPR